MKKVKIIVDLEDIEKKADIVKRSELSFKAPDLVSRIRTNILEKGSKIEVETKLEYAKEIVTDIETLDNFARIAQRSLDEA